MDPIFRRILTEFYRVEINGRTYRHEHRYEGNELVLKVFLTPVPRIRIVFVLQGMICTYCTETLNEATNRYDYVASGEILLPTDLAETILSNPVFPTRRSLQEILDNTFNPIDIWALDLYYEAMVQDFPTM